MLDLFATYELQLPSRVVLPNSPCSAIEGLRCYLAFTYCLCNSCLTRSKYALEVHVSKAHQQKLARQAEGSSWRKCTVQTFFAEKQYIRYFIVAGEGEGEERGLEGGEAKAEQGLSVEEQEFFRQQDADVEQAGQDATTVANTVYGFESHRSAVVP